jgi:hypothetical protein
MSDEAFRYEQLHIGAEFLAGLSKDADERTVHLKMAGVYWQRAQEAGSEAKPRTTH